MIYSKQVPPCRRPKRLPSSFALWAGLSWDQCRRRSILAYEMAYPGLSLDQSLYEHYLSLAESGESSLTGFVSGIKGKLAEFNARDVLRRERLHQR